jgi:cytoskeleton protein RodZ
MAVTEEVDVTVASEVNLQESASLGEVLLAARIAKQLTQQDVSNSLRFSLKQIDALETNTFIALPDAMITRGFIRNYARLLELDAEPLLAVYRAHVPAEQPNPLVVQSSMQQVKLTKDSKPWLSYILGSILVLLFLLAWFFYMDYMPKLTDISIEKAVPASEVTTPTLESAPLSLPEIALPAAERLAGGVDGAVNELDASNANVTVADVATNTAQANVNFPPETKKEPELAGVQRNQLPPNTMADLTVKTVNMSFSEETWVSVTDKSGQVVFEKTLPAGSAESVEGMPPFNLVIGNAKATKLVFLGQSVDLAAYAKNNVARVRLE